MKKGSSSFLKKRTKKLLSVGVSGAPALVRTRITGKRSRSCLVLPANLLHLLFCRQLNCGNTIARADRRRGSVALLQSHVESIVIGKDVGHRIRQYSS